MLEGSLMMSLWIIHKKKPLMKNHEFRGQLAVQNAYDSFDKDNIHETRRQQC